MPRLARAGTGSCVICSPRYQIVPRGRPQMAGDHADEGGLAGAVRPDDAAQLAAREPKIDRIVGEQALEALGQALGAQELGHGAQLRRAGKQSGDRAGHAALQEQDHQHEQDAERELPVAGHDRAQIVRERGYEDAAEQRAEQGVAPADRDPHHDFGREQDAGERRGHEVGVRAVEGAGEAGDRAREREGPGLVERGAHAERQQPVLVLADARPGACRRARGSGP